MLTIVYKISIRDVVVYISAIYFGYNDIRSINQSQSASFFLFISFSLPLFQDGFCFLKFFENSNLAFIAYVVIAGINNIAHFFSLNKSIFLKELLMGFLVSFLRRNDILEQPN